MKEVGLIEHTETLIIMADSGHGYSGAGEQAGPCCCLAAA